MPDQKLSYNIPNGSLVRFPIIPEDGNPLTPEQIASRADENKVASATITIRLSDAVGHYLDGFLDFIAEKAFGSNAVADVDYNVVGLGTDQSLLVTVSGDVSRIIEDI